MRRWWIVGGLVLVLALTGLGVGVAWRSDDRPCGATVTSYAADDSPSPLLDAPGPAPRVLLDALAADGPVRGSLGYDYTPPQVTSYAAGLGVRLRDDNRFTLLDDTSLEPRWSVTVGTRSSTFDRSDDEYAVVTLPEDAAPDVVALDLATGERRWCASLGGDAVTDEPVSTRVLDDGSLLALLGSSSQDGSEQRLLRVGADGVGWEVSPGAAAGDRLETTGADGDLVVVGGSPLTDLLDPALLAANDDDVALAAYSVSGGRPAWTVPGARGRDLALAGTTDDTVVVVEAVAGQRQPALVGLAADDGSERWRLSPARGTAFDTTVRGDRVLVRAGTTWTSYDAATGAEQWSFAVPAAPQFLPYGTTLDQLPSLDADSLLVGGTEALVTLDLRDGSRTAVPLPTDGVSTTYWPVALAVSPASVAVVTNVGTVVVGR